MMIDFDCFDLEDFPNRPDDRNLEERILDLEDLLDLLDLENLLLRDLLLLCEED